jgi:hypothetical protein
VESVETKVVEIPIDGWRFDRESIIIRVGLCSITVPFTQHDLALESPRLILEVKCHR